MGTSAASIGAAIRRTVIDQSRRAHVGHIGSALSVSDLLAVLFGTTMNGTPDDPDRDRFVLSKGHAALALYAALHEAGHLSAEDLDTYCADGSPLGCHPEHPVPGIDFSTGSLGQGLSLAAGAALAARMQRSKRRSFAVLSDAELNEGSIWEAVMFAAHHKLSNLVAIVDVNGQQALGYTRDVIDLHPLADRFGAFGWDVHEVDGHDTETLERTIAGLDVEQGPPHVLLANTTFGYGVDFMESKIEWHYWPLDEHQYASAVEQLEAAR
ncbi:transketolase [Solirubrobacter sp. CPCC 204708]|uniref:Transketolase n=1 Tax=Solirubrobacter deserti TaxID=2282478 RepID=A0ABT4RN77_9ACTN|nr:transketolase [Solirubrobacter deserti]MBE2317431.1 transketolase [Solirubrobacter deserti]MDA0140013.1 transketolase [Solirubrobacter deserti]